MDDQELQQKGRRLVELRERRDQAKTALERAETDYREAEAELWEAFDESPVQGARKIDLGEPYGVVTLQAKETYYGRILDEDQALDFLNNNALTEEFTEPKIKKARINELVREYREANRDLSGTGLDFYAQRYVSISMPKK